MITTQIEPLPSPNRSGQRVRSSMAAEHSEEFSRATFTLRKKSHLASSWLGFLRSS
ncbi:hypothetical protein AVEN_11893-1, partial [Araneus ventricosus]